jgi:hypothetical protein
MTGATIRDASASRSVKAICLYFPTDMADDSAVYDSISERLDKDTAHIANEPIAPGMRLNAIKCIIGSAWRLHARGMWAPTLAKRLIYGHVIQTILALPNTSARFHSQLDILNPSTVAC